MRVLRCALLLLGLSGLGCLPPWESEFGTITGTVRYPDQTPVHMAKVTIAGVGTTYTDLRGNYRLELKSTSGVVTVTARDGYTPGRMYAVTSSGRAEVTVHRGLLVQDIVLDRSEPI
ncbi:MAG: carboxypeptidase regulatory-like domain-containing protein [Candidatus Eisenbacteria bacterium]